jgi:RNA polymerase sigma-70 factor (ECF subfamily)
MKAFLSSMASLFSVPDEQAMWQVRMHDDARAFAQLVRRWERPIQRLCARMLGDSHRGEDLAQEVFARLFAKRKEYQPTGQLSTFLWRIALNLCYDELRRMKRHPESPLEDEELIGEEGLPHFKIVQPGADTVLLERERGELVRKAVLQLSESYRAVVILRHYQDLKFREIAEVLGIPEGTVKSRMAEALAQLHEALSDALEDKEAERCRAKRPLPPSPPSPKAFFKQRARLEIQ